MDEPSKVITLNDFNAKVDRAINTLETKPVNLMTNKDHVNVMMCVNTILMTNDAKSSIHDLKKRFGGGRYDKLLDIVIKKSYTKKLLSIFPDCSFNRGSGSYFPQLKMEFYGTPYPYAYYAILD